MRFAVIADIHGNRLALETVLADIADAGVSEIVNLGDHLSGPLEAAATADLLIERDLPSIRGNHDRYLLETSPAAMGPSDKAAFDQLERRHLDWLASLPPTLIWRDAAFLCHGTPVCDSTYWLEHVTADGTVHQAPLAAIEREAVGIELPLILCAHSHLPRAVRLTNGRLVINPGSVGCPAYDDVQPVPHVVQSGTPQASYAIVERSRHGWNVAFRQVAYDHHAMAALAAANGRPEWARGLATGWIE